MKWTTIGEYDVSTANGHLYLLNGQDQPFINRLDGSPETQLADYDQNLTP